MHHWCSSDIFFELVVGRSPGNMLRTQHIRYLTIRNVQAVKTQHEMYYLSVTHTHNRDEVTDKQANIGAKGYLGSAQVFVTPNGGFAAFPTDTSLNEVLGDNMGSIFTCKLRQW